MTPSSNTGSGKRESWPSLKVSQVAGVATLIGLLAAAMIAIDARVEAIIATSIAKHEQSPAHYGVAALLTNHEHLALGHAHEDAISRVEVQARLDIVRAEIEALRVATKKGR